MARPGFRFLLSRIPNAKNKFHHMCAEIGEDVDHLFHGAILWGQFIE
jgi:hypothetical protein